MGLLGQSALLLAVVSFSLGVSVLTRNVRNKLFLAFAALGVVITGWSFLFFLFQIWPDSDRLYGWHLFFNIWQAPAGLIFLRIMIKLHDRFSFNLLLFSFLLALIFSLVLLTRKHVDSQTLTLLIKLTPFLISIQLLRLLLKDRFFSKIQKELRVKNLKKAAIEKRMLVNFIAVVILSITVSDHFSWVGYVIPTFGNLALCLFWYFLFLALSDQRLLNFSALFSRLIVILIVALFLTVVYSLLVSWSLDSQGALFFNSFVVSFFILALLEPLRTLVKFFGTRLLTREHQKLELLLRTAQSKLSGVVDINVLFDQIVSFTDSNLQPRWMGFYILRKDGTKYLRIRTLGKSIYFSDEYNNSDLNREVLADSRLLDYSRTLHQHGDIPIILDKILDNEIDRSASRSQRERFNSLLRGLRSLGANVLIPIFGGEKILGFVVFDLPTPPEEWGNNWGILRIIYPFFEEVGQSLQNMDIYVHQREKERLAVLGEMAAGLAHEIRNPLGAIKGAAQFLDPTEDKPESKFLTVIIEEVDRLNKVVTQFLEYSKPEPLEFVDADMSLLVEKTLEVLRHSWDEKIKLEFIKETSPAIVSVAPEQIRQLVLNLIQNSVRALKDVKNPVVIIRISKIVRDSSDFILLEVEDNGSGIKREYLEKIFIPFFTTSQGGTGLGLPICQKIIQAHDGAIEVQSEAGQTKFSVILPFINRR